METHLLDILRALLGLIVGGAIGLGFGLIQNAAYRRHEKSQERGKLTNGWAVLPGSAGRVACLLAALALVQLISPALFAGGGQWWVSAGVAGGYGVILFHQFRQRRALASLAPAGRG